MALDPWYKVVTPRKEVREGRSFNPDEFAIALEQVVAKRAPEDYRDPEKFFARTYFTRALTEHTGMILRRLAGQTVNTAPVVTLVTQFGGGKTHTLAALYHLVNNGARAREFVGVADLLAKAELAAAPHAKPWVFVGNAWDPQEGRETPWLDMARELAGPHGVDLLGKAARSSPPGTEALARLFNAAGGTVLVLIDEALNFVNRHRALAEPFHAFIQNLTVAMTGAERCAAVISLPRSQVEMTSWDQEWHEKITKVVRRVAKDLIANDEGEISEVVRRRLFEDLGPERLRKKVAADYAAWAFERRNRLPPEWTAVDTAATDAKAREFLQRRFEACYPFHPATLSVFQRKWATLPQYQQTRGTLAMLAQWVSCAQRDAFKLARTEPLITLGSAPLEVQDLRAAVLGQLGEPRLNAGIDADIVGPQSHARALDADTRGSLRDIHRRVGTAILFESSGGQSDKTAHLPELRFALGEPAVETTSIDNAAYALETRAYYLRKAGTDGFRFGYQPTLKKVVNDRRASLDDDSDIKPAVRKLVKEEWERGKTIPLVPFPADGTDIQDTPRLALVIADPAMSWDRKAAMQKNVAEWTQRRGNSPRLYPASLVWCLKKDGKELKEKVAAWLAWQLVKHEIDEGTLAGDFDRADRAELAGKVKESEEAARDEVWASYRYVVLSDSAEEGGLKEIDLAPGHSSAGATLCGRVIEAMKSEGLLNEGVGAGYLQRNWPAALAASGAWPLQSLRQSFLNGALTRLLDPDATLKARICGFVAAGDFGLAAGVRPDGTYDSVWFEENVDPADVSFDANVFLLTKAKAKELKEGVRPPGGDKVPAPQPSTDGGGGGRTEGVDETGGEDLQPSTQSVRVAGSIPPELWNRLGTKVLPKLRSAQDLAVDVEFTATVEAQAAESLVRDLRQALEELGAAGVQVSSTNRD
jgi:hypothetical protein